MSQTVVGARHSLSNLSILSQRRAPRDGGEEGRGRGSGEEGGGGGGDEGEMETVPETQELATSLQRSLHRQLAANLLCRAPRRWPHWTRLGRPSQRGKTLSLSSQL